MSRDAPVSVAALTNRMENTLERMGGTECGSDWVISALDPFHDTALKDLDGFPDGTGMNSVVEVVTSAMTVSCPSSVTSGTWEAHVTNYNWLDSIGLYPSYLESNTAVSNSGCVPPIVYSLVSANPAGIQTGGVSVATGPSGFRDGSTSSTNAGFLTPAASYITGSYRVIGQAFEIYSIGPALYRAGVSYTWRLPTPGVEESPIALNLQTGATASNLPNFMKAYILDAPPAVVADAELIPNTVMLNAEEGVYCVSRFNKLAAPISDYPMASPVIRLGLSSYSSSNGNTVYNSYSPNIWTSNLTAGSYSWGSVPVTSSAQINNFDLSGSMLTGLNLNDVLEIRCRWIIEKFPTIDEANILVLATPSPKYDPIALEAYSRVSSTLPVGVPVRANSLGDWFREAASTLSSIAGPILKAIPHPVAQAASRFVSAASTALKPTKKKVEQKKLAPGVNQNMQTKIQKKNIMPKAGGLKLKKK